MWRRQTEIGPALHIDRLQETPSHQAKRSLNQRQFHNQSTCRRQTAEHAMLIALARYVGDVGLGERARKAPMMVNGSVVKHGTRTQATRALSPAETDYYAVITGSGGSRNAVDDVGLGAGAQVLVWTDSNAVRRLRQEETLGKPDMWN